MAQEPITAAPLTITNQNNSTFTIPAALNLPTARPIQFPDTLANTGSWGLYSANGAYPGTFTYNASGDYFNVTATSNSSTGFELTDWITLPEGAAGTTFKIAFTVIEASHSGNIYVSALYQTPTGGATTSGTTSFMVNAQNMGANPMLVEKEFTVPTGRTGVKFRVTSQQNERSLTYKGVTVSCTAQPTGATWGAGALTDGHLEGFWTSPTMLGDILDNPVSGGGLQPANPQYGTRPVNYVAYLTASTRSQVYDEVKRLTALLSVGKLKVNHHGEGWIWDGWLAAPPAVTWLSNDYPTVRLDFTITYTDPYIWQVDWSTQRALTNYAYEGRQNPVGLIADGAFYNAGNKDMSSSTYASFTVRNPGQADSYPVIFINFGPSTDATYPRATYFTFYYYGAVSQWYSHFGPVYWDGNGQGQGNSGYGAYSSWMIDTRTMQAYAGWSSEDGYKTIYLPGEVVAGDSFKVPAGSYKTLYISSESGVGDISVLVPQGRI